MSMLWQRFTERSKRVVIAAQEIAAQAGERYVCPEHLLIGLVKQNDSVAAKVLESLGVQVETLRLTMEHEISRRKRKPLNNNDVTLDMRVKRVLDFAYDESRQAGMNYIGTEHLLLGVLREGDGIACRTLAKLGLDIITARKEVASYPGEMVQPPAESKPRLTYEIRKFSDPAEATLWMNSMIARGFKKTFSSTSAGQMWAIFESRINTPGDNAAPRSGAAADTEAADDSKFRREIKEIISDLVAPPETETRGGSTTQDDSEASAEAES